MWLRSRCRVHVAQVESADTWRQALSRDRNIATAPNGTPARDWGGVAPPWYSKQSIFAETGRHGLPGHPPAALRGTTGPSLYTAGDFWQTDRVGGRRPRSRAGRRSTRTLEYSRYARSTALWC